MIENESVGRTLAKATRSFMGHAAALIVGVLLMIAGIAMGVTLVLLPIGIPVGLAGLAFFLWGLFGRAHEQDRAAGPGTSKKS
jgi:cbb3-type cytochrome oxidase maturation protein